MRYTPQTGRGSVDRIVTRPARTAAATAARPHQPRATHRTEALKPAPKDAPAPGGATMDYQLGFAAGFSG